MTRPAATVTISPMTPTPSRAELEALIRRITTRTPIQVERVQPIDDRQIELTERWIVPALPLLEAEFLAIRLEIDEAIRAHLAAHPDKALHGDPQRYPKGYCLQITQRAMQTFLLRGLGAEPSEALQAVLAFGEAGGHVGRVWGILRDRYFQNAMQFGSHYFDVANDTVDVTKPKIEHMPMAESGFRNVDSLADFIRVGEPYWGSRFFPNLHFPRLAITHPLLQLRQRDGQLRAYRCAASMQWRHWDLDFAPVEDHLREALRHGSAIPADLFERIEAFRRARSLPHLPIEGFGEARLEELCAEARSRYRDGKEGEERFGRELAQGRHVLIDHGTGADS